MSFRWRLFFGLSVTVLATALVYSTLGFFSFKRSLDAGIETDLADYLQAVTNSLDLSEARPRFLPSPADQAALSGYGNAGFYVSQSGQIVLEYGKSLEIGQNWRSTTVDLGDGYTAELFLNVDENREALASYARTALLALTLALAITTLISLLLQRYLLRPVRELQRGVEQLSRQAIPEPVAVPPGDDELSHLAESFNRMTESLHAFLERERAFTRYASHELRTPLSNLRVLSEGMQKGILTYESALPEVDTTLVRMEGILSGLLDLSRSPTLQPEELALVTVVERSVQGLKPVERARIRFETKSSARIMAQGDLLNRVVVNLLHNALKYSQERVLVEMFESEDEVCISVRDYGPGVPEQSLGNLAEPFYRLDTRQSGLGLGLALVRHIVTALGGQLEFMNATPGLAVSVRFPKAPPPAEVRQPLNLEVAHA